MTSSYRYTNWDGSQAEESLDADDLLSSLADDLLNFGDLQHALRNLMQRGVETPQGDNMQGLRDMLQDLRQQRRDQLDKYNLSSVLEELKEALSKIIENEQSTVTERLEQTKAFNESEPDEAKSPAEGGETDEDQENKRLNDLLQSIAQKKQDFLDDLSDNEAEQLKSLQSYEFLSPEANDQFQELLERLKEAMSSQMLDQMKDSLNNMSQEDKQRTKDMISDLNDMINQKIKGEEPDFDSFMEKYGDMMGDNPPQSLDELLEQLQEQMNAMQSLMSSLPSGERDQLQELLSNSLGDPELQAELNELSENLSFLNSGKNGTQYPFRGGEDISLEAAADLMKQMNL